MNIVYILGNGFDLNIGLKTSYTDFYNFYNSLASSKENIKFLKESISKDYQTWADLELGLGKFTDSLNDSQEFIDVFEDISDQLALYLEKEEAAFDFSLIDKQKFFADLCFPNNYLPMSDSAILSTFMNKRKEAWNLRFITLNYTRSLEKILQTDTPNLQIGTTADSLQIKLRDLQHLHGTIDERMIMGVNDISQIANTNFHTSQELIEAFVKPTCNQASKATVDRKCMGSILSANLICIFGCSLGDTDKIWWELIGGQLMKDVMLLIFTRGSEINRRRPYKGLTIERQIKRTFLDKTNLSESEKDLVINKIIVGHNTQLFSHMRLQP